MKKGFTILEALFSFVLLIIIFSCAFPTIASEIQRDKNVATEFLFTMVNATSTNARAHGVTIIPYMSYWNDSSVPSAFTSTSCNASEIATSGWYNFSLNASEMNHDYIAVELNATGAVSNGLLINTKPKTLLTEINSTTNSTVTQLTNMETNLTKVIKASR